MEFSVDVFDYGRYGCTVKEPRTGLSGDGDSKEEAMDDLRRKLWHFVEYDYVPPVEGPVRTIETMTL